ncbi:unnamed protein product, partial [Brassica oleracea]
IYGYKFRASGRDDGLKTQHSGVYVNANTVSYASSRDQNPKAGDIAYYGKLVEVIELNYYETFRVVLFKRKWADTRSSRGCKHDVYGHNMVNFDRLLHTGDEEEDEPYVLASQAKMVYYVEDPYANGKIEEQTLTTKEVWKLQNGRVIVHFDDDCSQPDEDSGGLLRSWLGQLSNDVNLLPIDYADWKVFAPHRKDKVCDIFLVTKNIITLAT